MTINGICISVCLGFRQQDAPSVNLAVNCAVNEGLCDQMCESGDPEAGTLDHCLCRAGFTLDTSGRKCLGRYHSSPYEIQWYSDD